MELRDAGVARAFAVAVAQLRPRHLGPHVLVGSLVIHVADHPDGLLHCAQHVGVLGHQPPGQRDRCSLAVLTGDRGVDEADLDRAPRVERLAEAGVVARVGEQHGLGEHLADQRAKQLTPSLSDRLKVASSAAIAKSQARSWMNAPPTQ